MQNSITLVPNKLTTVVKVHNYTGLVFTMLQMYIKITNYGPGLPGSVFEGGHCKLTTTGSASVKTV